jgi:hypothetical protein
MYCVSYDAATASEMEGNAVFTPKFVYVRWDPRVRSLLDFFVLLPRGNFECGRVWRVRAVSYGVWVGEGVRSQACVCGGCGSAGEVMRLR